MMMSPLKDEEAVIKRERLMSGGVPPQLNILTLTMDENFGMNYPFYRSFLKNEYRLVREMLALKRSCCAVKTPF